MASAARDHLAWTAPRVKLDAQGAVIVHTGVTEQGQGAEAVMAQCVAPVVWRADRQGSRHHRRHRQHALWRRHLGLARGRHRRRSGLAGRQGAARRMCSRSPARCCRQSLTSSISSTPSSSTRTRAPSACRSRSWRGSPSQHLLREAGSEDIDEELISVAAEGLEAQADWTSLGSPGPTSATRRGRTSTPPTASRTTSLAATSRPSRSRSTPGPWTGTGRSRSARAY